MTRYLFIPGMSRSGTSWVTRWLREHPAVHAVQETYLLRYASDLVYHEPRNGRIVTMELARAFVETVYRRHAADKPWVVDKSPGPLLYRDRPIIDFTLEMFPEARVLCFIRDGKDYVYGLLNLPWPSKLGWTVATASDSWIQDTTALLDRGRDPRVMLVRHEDLLGDPAMSRAITAFAGLSHHRDIEPWKRPVNTIHTRPDRQRWKALSDPDLKTMTRMNPQLERWGYEPV